MWMEKTTFAKKNPAQRVPTTGAPNYLTSPGGWLQAAWAGWGGLRLNASALHIRRPAPPPNATAMALRGVRFRGNLLDIRIDNDEVSPTAYVFCLSLACVFTATELCCAAVPHAEARRQHDGRRGAHADGGRRQPEAAVAWRNSAAASCQRAGPDHRKRRRRDRTIAAAINNILLSLALHKVCPFC